MDALSWGSASPLQAIAVTANLALPAIPIELVNGGEDPLQTLSDLCNVAKPMDITEENATKKEKRTNQPHLKDYKKLLREPLIHRKPSKAARIKTRQLVLNYYRENPPQKKITKKSILACPTARKHFSLFDENDYGKELSFLVGRINYEGNLAR
jgi:hypothetical protein